MSVKILGELASDEEIKDFLLYHMDEADDKKSKTNPALTRQQVWDINMGAVMKGDITRVRTLIIKNLTKEFGKYYEVQVTIPHQKWMRVLTTQLVSAKIQLYIQANKCEFYLKDCVAFFEYGEIRFENCEPENIKVVLKSYDDFDRIFEKIFS